MVLLAALICVTAAFTAFKLYAHVVPSTGFRRLAFTALTSVCTGSGIWATHFVAMLAYSPGVPLGYEPVTTIGSLLVAIAVTGTGFWLAAQPGDGNPATGGAIIGAGIGAMHYTGMSAVLVPGMLHWEIPTAVASVLIGMGLSSVALVKFHKGSGLPATATGALLLTLAICGLHFTAMGAVIVVPDPTILATASSMDNSKLALGVTAITLVLLVSGLAAALVETEASRQRKVADEDFRRQSQVLAQEVEERRRLFETSLDLILITDSKGNFVRVSPSSVAILGYAAEEMVGRSATEFIFGDDLEPTRQEVRQARSGRSTRNFETRYVHKDGRVVTLAWSGVWSEPEQKHFFVGRDMTERRMAEDRLKVLAHYDELTGLPNRNTLRSDLETLLHTGGEREVCVALFDLDGFKDVNDTLGHSAGDRLLQEVAERFREVARAYGAKAYRIGGDEFVLVMPERAKQDAVGPISSLQDRLADRFEVNGQGIFIAACAGVAAAPQDGTDMELLMANADLALYDAKAAGGRTLRMFLPLLREKAHARRSLDTELRRAFVESEFVLHYQPQLRLSDGALVGAEALLRWRHPEKGLVAPGTFIDALAQSRIAVDVGRWILEAACAAAAGWRAQGHAIRIGINLFPAHFRVESLRHDVESALAHSGLPADALELEITENIALRHDDSMLLPLHQLREMGVGLAFDDFGTGYASLSHLTRCPLSRIKIDRSFVSRIGEDAAPEACAIVRAVIVLAHNLGLAVTAEGIELAVQEAFLHAEGCDEGQGFYYSRPLAPSEYIRFAKSVSPFIPQALAG
jgi:diguanylate cyclase (GGDEF)-like protein/PAS domain S-box-containing protein